MTEQVELSKIFEYRDGQLWRKAFTQKNNKHIPEYKIIETGNMNGYTSLSVNYKKMTYHRIVWILHYGEIPKKMVIDHIDGNKTNSRIENLRLVTHRENCQNFPQHRNGKLAGCYYHKPSKKWRAHAMVEGKQCHLGYFRTMEEAHQAYLDFLNPRFN